jgi:cell division septum initiation protein DivIVA
MAPARLSRLPAAGSWSEGLAGALGTGGLCAWGAAPAWKAAKEGCLGRADRGSGCVRSQSPVRGSPSVNPLLGDASPALPNGRTGSPSRTASADEQLIELVSGGGTSHGLLITPTGSISANPTASRPPTGPPAENRLAGKSRMRETLGAMDDGAKREMPEAMDDLAPNGKLSTAFHGYAREPVDSLLAKIEERYGALLAERDELRESLADTSLRLDGAIAELEDRKRKERAIADAVIEAERLKAAGEEQADAIKSEAVAEAAETRQRAAQAAQEVKAAAERDAEGIRREAQLEAETIVRDAEAARDLATSEADKLLRGAQSRADRLFGEVQQSLEQRQHRAEELLDDVGVRLGTLVRDLFDQIGGPSQEPGTAVESERGPG